MFETPINFDPGVAGDAGSSRKKAGTATPEHNLVFPGMPPNERTRRNARAPTGPHVAALSGGRRDGCRHPCCDIIYESACERLSYACGQARCAP